MAGVGGKFGFVTMPFAMKFGVVSILAGFLLLLGHPCEAWLESCASIVGSG